MRWLDHDTIAKAQRGDVAAREELTRRYYPRVLKHVRRNEARAGSECDAHDIAQEVFVRALRSLDTFSGSSSFERWLYVIAKRAAFDFYRARGTLAVAAEPEAAAESTLGLKPSTPLEQLMRSETLGNVRSAFARLSPDHREVLTHRIVRHLSIQETAKLMRRSEGAVKMLQLRAIEALAASFSRHDPSRRSAEGGA